MKHTDCKISLFLNDLTVLIAKHPRFSSYETYIPVYIITTWKVKKLNVLLLPCFVIIPYI
jgi:hypothetical protein